MSQKKQIFELSILKKFLNDANSCVSLVPSTRLLALPPFFLNDMKSGIFYLLNSILKKYDRSLDGIVIGYQNVKILMDENTGIIPIGSAETEVNISVDFYIFQPKIGNTLEGVINKKSSSHIGCLVHKYFNATILKPEDVEFEDWNCKDFDVNDKILFKVKDLDFSGLLPYIEGSVCDEELLKCTKTKIMDGCDLDVNKDIQSKILSESTSHTKKKKKKKEKDEEISKSSKKKEEESIFPDFLLQKYLNSGSESDMKPISRKKEKKKKSEKTQPSPNKTVESVPLQNELFYSTQLEPTSECKMNTSCSPIPKQMSDLYKDKSETPMENKAKRKDRKRKAEDSSHSSAAKKSKKDHSQINGTADLANEFLHPELHKVREMLNVSEKKEEEKKTSKNDSIYAKLMEDVKNEISFDKNYEADSDSTRFQLKKKKKKKHKKHKTKSKEEKFKNGSMYDIELSPEKVNEDKNYSSDAEPSDRSSVKKKDKNKLASTRKSLIQTMLDQFFKEEGTKLKSDSDRESLRESTSKKKKKPKVTKSTKETEESLYEKLLREAKSRIEMNEDSSSKKKRKTG